MSRFDSTRLTRQGRKNVRGKSPTSEERLDKFVPCGAEWWNFFPPAGDTASGVVPEFRNTLDVNAAKVSFCPISDGTFRVIVEGLDDFAYFKDYLSAEEAKTVYGAIDGTIPVTPTYLISSFGFEFY